MSVFARNMFVLSAHGCDKSAIRVQWRCSEWMNDRNECLREWMSDHADQAENRQHANMAVESLEWFSEWRYFWVCGVLQLCNAVCARWNEMIVMYISGIVPTCQYDICGSHSRLFAPNLQHHTPYTSAKVSTHYVQNITNRSPSCETLVSRFCTKPQKMAEIKRTKSCVLSACCTVSQKNSKERRVNTSLTALSYLVPS